METVKSIVDGVNVGLTGRADADDPVVAKTDEEIHNQVQEATIQARSTHTCINLHVTDWVATQQEDVVLKTTIDWIPNRKVQKLNGLLGDDMSMEEGMAILQEQRG